MPVLRCKMCGGTMEIDAKQSVAVCQYCGTRQTLPKLDSERVAGLYERAELLRRGNDFDKAAAVYEQIVSLAPNDAEAYWSLVLCRYGIEYVEDPASHKRVPTINRVQFGSILKDTDYLSALQNADEEQKSVYIAEAKAIEAIQKGYLAISERENPFDVFICYKETDDNGRRTMDSVLANDLYHQLTQEGFKVFFSRITLEDKLGTEYEPYIFAALNSAKVMVVLGTRPEYFSAVWVRNEWSRFLALIKNGEQKVLIPAYRDMSPYDLPEEFSHLQALDMSRLGFMQDLIRGIKKILGTENVAGAANTATSPLLRRAFLFLEDKDWRSAAEYSEKILDQEPENARAYLCKLMAELQASKPEDLRRHRAALQKSSAYRRAVQYADAALKAELESYAAAPEPKKKPERTSCAPKPSIRKEQSPQKSQKQEPCKPNNKKRLTAAILAVSIIAAAAIIMAIGNAKKERTYTSALALLSSGEYAQASEAFAALPGYKNADSLRENADMALAEQERKAAEQQKKDAYATALALLNAGKFEEAIAAFNELGDYSDAAAKANAARQQKESVERETENQSAYKAAEKLLAAEEYDAAMEAFAALGDYADASDRAAEAKAAKQAAEEEAANKEAYDTAEKLLEEKKYADAKAAFEALGEYSDAEEKAAKCQEQMNHQMSVTPDTKMGDSSNTEDSTNAGNESAKQNDTAAENENKSTNSTFYFTYEYDAEGRIKKRNRIYYELDGQTDVLTSYDTYQYDANGQLKEQGYYTNGKFGTAPVWHHTNYYKNGILVYSKGSDFIHYFDENQNIICYGNVIQGRWVYTADAEYARAQGVEGKPVDGRTDLVYIDSPAQIGL